VHRTTREAKHLARGAEHELHRGFHGLTHAEKRAVRALTKEIKKGERFTKKEGRRIEHDAAKAAHELKISLKSYRKKLDREIPAMLHRAAKLSAHIERDMIREAEKANKEIAKHAGEVAAQAAMITSALEVAGLVCAAFPPLGDAAALVLFAAADAVGTVGMMAAMVDLAEHPTPGKAMDELVQLAIERGAGEAGKAGETKLEKKQIKAATHLTLDAIWSSIKESMSKPKHPKK
jgi:hypothetical protein